MGEELDGLGSWMGLWGVSSFAFGWSGVFILISRGCSSRLTRPLHWQNSRMSEDGDWRWFEFGLDRLEETLDLIRILF